MLQLYIGNKNYSSWSLRPWLLMKQCGIEFEEIRLRLSWDPESSFKTTLRQISPAGRVPVLVDDGFAVWDTLAIIEYLAEGYPDAQVWPRDRHARARARSLCAEMHAGFSALRAAFPMNIEASLPEIGPKCVRERPDVASDLNRLEQLWSTQLALVGGPFLFGEFCVADAFFAPVCSRLQTYCPPLTQAAGDYARRILAVPAMVAWCDAARAEHDFIPEDEPYRTRREVSGA